MKSKPTVSVVLTAHREGFLASATMKSLARAISDAETQGISVETVVSLDRPDDITRSTINSWQRGDLLILEHNFGDPALCRNRCIEMASGEYVSILDADDLIGSNWLRCAVSAARVDPREIVWHPEINVVFGETPHVFGHLDMEVDAFDPLWLVATNPWTSLCFAKRSVFVETPYPACNFDRSIGHEDWAWNRFVVERGFVHKVVKGTGHAIRRKTNSYMKQASNANAIPAPTGLFRKILQQRKKITSFRRPLMPFRP